MSEKFSLRGNNPYSFEGVEFINSQFAYVFKNDKYFFQMKRLNKQITEQTYTHKTD